MSSPAFDFRTLTEPPGGPTVAAEWWIAWGHLRSKQSTVLINIITMLSIVGVMVGVAVLNCVVAVMAGFEVDLRDKILGTNAHVVVMQYGAEGLRNPEAVVEAVEGVPGVAAAAPFVYGEMMIRSKAGHTGVIIKGVDVGRTGDVTHLRDDLVWGYGGAVDTPEEKAELFATLAADLPPLNAEIAEDEKSYPGIFIGRDLQAQLQVRPGDKIQLINPIGGGPGVMGMPAPTVKSFRIAGIFDSGMYEYNTKWTYVRNQDAQAFLKIGDVVNGIEVKLTDIHAAPSVTEQIQERLGYPYYAKHWQELNEKLFAALKLEKYVMSLILSMIVCVAALLVVSTLIMVVLTKGREIAILKAMGASNAMISRVFLMQGSFIAIVGITAGTALGMFGCWALWAYGWPLETDVYYLSTLPVVVEAENVVGIAVAAFTICFVSTVLPAMLAATLDPVEGLRYE
ncbi:MAG: ABC transporter permease [Alphaproteobacteria bacterium]|nr:ABC transporter permease [Alphaproteobacteria bacterium]